MITGDDYISLAGKLAARPDAGEASYRSAVSRAYYGAYHLAAALLIDLGFDVPKGASAHGWLPHVLYGSGQEAAQDAAHFLQDLHSERITADYHWDKRKTGNLEDARMCVETAQEIRLALAACGHEPARSCIRMGIDGYLRRRAGQGHPRPSH